MPIASERWSDRQYTPGRSASRGVDVLFTDGENVTEPAAVSCAGTLGVTIGASHPYDSRLLADPPNVSYAGPRLLHVSYTYSRDTGSGTTGQQERDPLDELPVYSWSTGFADEVAERDIDGNPLVNSNGDLFDGAHAPLVETTLRVVRNLATFDVNLSLAFVQTVNEGPFHVPGPGSTTYTVPAGWALCTSILPVGGYTRDAKFVPVEFTIGIRTPVTAFERDGTMSLWDWKFLDQGENGRFRLADGTLKFGPWVTSGRDRVGSLRLDGRALPIDPDKASSVRVGFNNLATPVAAATGPRGATFDHTANACFLWYRKHRRQDFNALPLR